MPSNINRLAVPTLGKGLHVVVRPCNLRRSLFFKEIAILAVPQSPCLQNTLSMTAQASFVDGPRRPWPSRRRYCSGASKGGHYIGTYGGGAMSPPRYSAKAKAPRSLIAVSIRLVQPAVRPGQAGVARELQFKSHFKARQSQAERQTRGA
jgi:hypothetical protein